MIFSILDLLGNALYWFFRELNVVVVYKDSSSSSLFRILKDNFGLTTKFSQTCSLEKVDIERRYLHPCLYQL